MPLGQLQFLEHELMGLNIKLDGSGIELKES